MDCLPSMDKKKKDIFYISCNEKLRFFWNYIISFRRLSFISKTWLNQFQCFV